jgi:hypothetical protein
MSETLWHLNQKAKQKHKTFANQYSDFPVGSRVKIICIFQDYMFFTGHETGTVIANHYKYLGIHVEFDEPRQLRHESKYTSFNFEPSDLILFKGETIK